MSGDSGHKAIAPAGPLLDVDLDAVRANYRTLADQAAEATCAAVVKADAYGLGALQVVPALFEEGARHFFIATLEEGRRLDWILRETVGERDACAIYVLNGPLPGSAGDFLEAGLIPVLNGLDQVAEWSGLAARLERTLPGVLHVDSGMARLGLSPAEVGRLVQDPGVFAGIEPRMVMSHLACAEEPANAINEDQRRRFDETRARLPEAPASLANSAGIFLGRAFHYDMVRPGCALYGVNPTPGRDSPVLPVVRLTTRIIQTRTVDRPQTVGYGATWQAQGPTRVATIAFGYADGYPRYLSDKGGCFIAGERVPVIGRVSMDLITLDVTKLPENLTLPGAEVEILGPHYDVDEFAADAGTIGYEVLTNLATGARIERRFSGGLEGV